MKIKTTVITALSLCFISIFAIADWVPGPDPSGRYYKTGENETYYGIREGVNLYVLNGGPENLPTLLTIQSGSILNGSIDVRGDSMAIAINTGTSGIVRARESSTIELVSGDYGNIYLGDDSTLRLSGTGYGVVETRQTSHFIMKSGGRASFLRAFDDSRMNIEGGGTLSYLVASDNATIEISGGTFALNPELGSYVEASENGTIIISGGNFTEGDFGHAHRIKFDASQDGILKFIGSDFTVNGTPVAGLLNLEGLVENGIITRTTGATHYTYRGTLQGSLRNGQSLHNEFRIERAIDSAESANINLYPSSCLINEELEEQLLAANAEIGALYTLLDAADALAASLQARLDAATPATPTDLIATAVAFSEVALNWTDNADNETEFIVEQSLSGVDNWSVIATLGPDVMTFNAQNLSQLTSYKFRVKASNAIGDFGYSNVATEITPAAIPPAPTALIATSVSSSEIDLSWTDSSQFETGFVVEQRVSAGAWSVIATLPANALTHTASSLSPSTQYEFRVKAFNDAGDSGYSNTATATTSTGPVVNTRSEAEDGSLKNMLVDNTIPGYSGTGYTDADNFQKGDNVTVRYTPPAAGVYDLIIRYHSPYGDKSNNVSVNGARIGGTNQTFPESASWTTIIFSGVNFIAGENVIRLKGVKGAIHVDYFEIVDGASSP